MTRSSPSAHLHHLSKKPSKIFTLMLYLSFSAPQIQLSWWTVQKVSTLLRRVRCESGDMQLDMNTRSVTHSHILVSCTDGHFTSEPCPRSHDNNQDHNTMVLLPCLCLSLFSLTTILHNRTHICQVPLDTAQLFIQTIFLVLENQPHILAEGNKTSFHVCLQSKITMLICSLKQFDLAFFIPPAHTNSIGHTSTDLTVNQ